MATTCRPGRYSVVFIVVLLVVTGYAGVSHGTGFIVGQHTIALDIVMPKDKAAFKAGESVYVTVKSSGFTA
jgi:hypothetical protein